MIVEGIITTEDAQGKMHIAPIGPHVDRELTNWVLKPFQTSTTFANLHRTNQGVFHILDDGLLLVQSVLGLCNTNECKPQAEYRTGIGWVIPQTCRAFPMKVVHWDTSNDRAVAKCTVGDAIELRPFWGWNRAASSLLELAVLWSRRHLMSPNDLATEFQRHRVIIDKTAGDRELRAYELLDTALKQFTEAN